MTRLARLFSRTLRWLAATMTWQADRLDQWAPPRVREERAR